MISNNRPARGWGLPDFILIRLISLHKCPLMMIVSFESRYIDLYRDILSLLYGCQERENVMRRGERNIHQTPTTIAAIIGIGQHVNTAPC
jgi:hypothetical protein